MEESTGVVGGKGREGWVVGGRVGEDDEADERRQNMSVYATRVPVGSQTVFFFQIQQAKVFLVLGEILLSLIRLRTVSS